MNAASLIYKTLRRLQARTLGQLLRGGLVRVWPFSHFIHRHYRARLSPDRWNNLNKRAIEVLRDHEPTLNSTQQTVLDDLKADGIHVTTLDRLLNANGLLKELQNEAEALFQRPEIRDQIEHRISKDGIKWYVVRVFGFQPTLAVPASIASLVLDDRVLDIANSYLGVCSRIKYLDIWCNLPCDEGDPPVDSERWHRDNEDNQLIKLFLYLSDVDENSGPLSYIRGSQPGGRYGSIYPNNPPTGSFPPDGALENDLPTEEMYSCAGDAGTLLLYDACGFHRGGCTTNKPRIMLVATYASDAALDPLTYTLQNREQYEDLSVPGKFAIRALN
jgi:hypothetical protein